MRTLPLLLLLLATGVRSQDIPPVRVGGHPGFTRVVLDLPKGATYEIEPLGAALRVTLRGVGVSPGIRFVERPELAGYVLEQHEDRAVLLLLTPQGATPRSGYRTLSLPALEGEGERLVVDLSGAFVDRSPLTPQPAFRFVRASGRRFSVVVDAGHGGSDPGALGPVAEKWVTLELALRVRRFLQEAGVEVVLTREGDTALSADKRTDLSYRAALANGKHLFVSIHANAAPPGKAEGWCGLEVYYHGPPGARPFFPSPAPLPPTPSPLVTTPMELAAPLQPGGLEPTPTDLEDTPSPAPRMNSLRRQELSRSLASRVLAHMLGTTAAFNRGVRSADFYVLRHTTVPAVLVEVGYLSHPLEGLNLTDPHYLDRLAYGLAQGVLAYLENDHPLESSP
ncbi:MAG: N-acetylmuramoyl-L-alanine amidase [Meiothermus sp.]|uniref:N-acetylmuramoyl-L-alanine amidase family protein n=1 Tax=Meiothermus sp. TaxID=1955249 RepID=UPI00261FD218|nr:N-acetylmuramoyl-L-alanine amidase [Meiothermus sp.]MCS7058952.1 N-acetylmuramoyl-L-alanine amidase [Meiothermus sp.]